MKKKFSQIKMIFAFLCIFSFLTGCITGEKVLELTEKDSGKSFEVETGSFVTVSLPVEPVSGRLWSFVSPVDLSRLALCRDNTLTPTGEKRLPGKNEGKRILKYEVIAPGKAALNLKYGTPWEYSSKDPERLFQVILYCVGKAKNRMDEEELIITPRRDQHGNDIRRKGLFDR